MTLQDTQAAEEEGKSASGQGNASGTLNRAGSVLEGLLYVNNNDHPKQKPELQLHVPGNAELSHGKLSRTASAASAAVHSPRMMSQELREGMMTKDESSESVVPPWRSNSAAAWARQKSLTRSLSAKAFPDGDQHEEEQLPWEQQADPDQAAGPQARARQSAPAPGRAKALGSLHIEVEEQPQQDGLQDWAESGLDDIAAAVAQYTGASPHDLFSNHGSREVAEQHAEQLPQQLQQWPQAAGLQLAESQSATRSPRVKATRQYATQQEQMEAELEAAMAADGEPVAEHVDVETEAAMGTEMSAPKYANAQEQMEAELEAAMAAEMSAPKYANVQEQMEAELEAAMAADAAADMPQHVRQGIEDNEQYPEEWERKVADFGAVMAAKTTAAALDRTPLHYSASEGRAGQKLNLPADGDGLDLGADGISGAQYLHDGVQKVQITIHMAFMPPPFKPSNMSAALVICRPQVSCQKRYQSGF